MKDDILKFRKCVDILKKEKHYTNQMIEAEMGLSQPSVTKLLKEDIAVLKIRPSVLGLVQDFNKKHCDDLNYAGVKAAPESAIEKKVDKLKKNLGNYKADEKKVEPLPEEKSLSESSDESAVIDGLGKYLVTEKPEPSIYDSEEVQNIINKDPHSTLDLSGRKKEVQRPVFPEDRIEGKIKGDNSILVPPERPIEMRPSFFNIFRRRKPVIIEGQAEDNVTKLISICSKISTQLPKNVKIHITIN